jgi:CubicO group peptidase (beta-lactamase class C family)
MNITAAGRPFPARKLAGRWLLLGTACLLSSVLVATPLHAQTVLTTGTPADVGMSAAVLEGAVGLYREAVASGELVGAVLLVARNGRVVVHEAIGQRDWQRNLPMERNTMFRMASNTKPVVATAIAMLVERGQLRYDDHVRKYIPAFDNYRAGFITVGQLLSHTSGLRIPTLFLEPYTTGSGPDGRPNLQTEVAKFGAVGAVFPPPAAYGYSNPGYNTLGAVIEVVSGRPLEVFLRDEIYRPLGMKDSYHLETAEHLGGKLNRMGAVYYSRDENGRWVPGWRPGDPPQVPFVRASGGMISTAWDYAIFLQTHLNGGTYGNTQLIAPQSVRTMTARQTPADGTAYGYGWRLEDGGVFSHGGSDGTNAWVDPERGIIGIVLTQTPRGRNPVQRFRQLVNLAIEDAPRRAAQEQ